MEQNTVPEVLVQTTLIPIRWGDMDAYRHVNNTVYFRYMEQVRVEYLERLGYSIAPKGTAPVIVNTSCTFLRPLSYPGLLEVKMFCGVPGRSSVPTRYEMRIQGSDTLCALGEAKIVWIDMVGGQSVPLPEALRSQLPEA